MGKAKRTHHHQGVGLDGYVAALLYPSYAHFLVGRMGKAKRTHHHQGVDLDGYVAALLYPSYYWRSSGSQSVGWVKRSVPIIIRVLTSTGTSLRFFTRPTLRITKTL